MSLHTLWVLWRSVCIIEFLFLRISFFHRWFSSACSMRGMWWNNMFLPMIDTTLPYTSVHSRQFQHARLEKQLKKGCSERFRWQPTEACLPGIHKSRSTTGAARSFPARRRRGAWTLGHRRLQCIEFLSAGKPGHCSVQQSFQARPKSCPCT